MKNPLRSSQLLAMFAATVCFSTATFAHLVANKSEIAPGETLTISLHADGARTDAGYLAIAAGNGIYFVDESGALVSYQAGQTTPRRMNGVAAGTRDVFSFTAPAGLDLSVTFYSVFGRDGVDLLANTSALDLATLEQAAVRFVPAAAASGGTDGRSLYAAQCASCHEAHPATNRYNIAMGMNAAATQSAIQHDRGGMGYLNFLTDNQLSAIADWIRTPN